MGQNSGKLTLFRLVKRLSSLWCCNYYKLIDYSRQKANVNDAILPLIWTQNNSLLSVPRHVFYTWPVPDARAVIYGNNLAIRRDDTNAAR